VLAAYIGVEAVRTLLDRRHRRQAGSGIGPAGFTAPTMPLFPLATRRVGRRLGSAATVKEGAQNLVRAYLSVALLADLLADAHRGWWWAGPAAALTIAAVALREGLEGWKGGGGCDAC
jgi:divalent metal cation (Fe/Co/Zn/Cd) transporter